MTEWFESSTSQIQGTSAPVALGASLPVAAERLGQEGLDLLGGRGVPLEEVAPLGQERGAAGWRRFGIRRREGGECGLVEDFITHHSITSEDKYRGKSGGYLAVAGKESILHLCWTKGKDIKQHYVPWSEGPQGAKKTAGHGVMSSHGKGLGSGVRAGEAV